MHPMLPNSTRRTSYDHTPPLRRVEETPSSSLRRRHESTPIESYQSVSDDAESWFEIPSDHIITTGLQVRSVAPKSVSNSSQDEYEESESESDRVLSSSNEELDVNLNPGPIDTFTPQPNFFSQPIDPIATRPSLSERLPSNRMITQRAIRQPDHDAALRASLTTLLSCAAAVRPKERERPVPTQQTSVQPTTLRLVSESQMIKPTKRRSREPSKERHAKKIRALKAEEEAIASTAMTWMISAGVVLVFSAISFSAGYAWGKEVGKFEGAGCGSCGREAIKTSDGLRKLRWSAAQSVSA